MQLYFIRHGQSTNNLLWLNTGSSEFRDKDPELSEAGKTQIQFLADYLKPGSEIFANGGYSNQSGCPALTHVYSSLMIRAIETGCAVARANSLPLLGHMDLHEGGGIYQDDAETGKPVGLPGNSRSYLENRFPDLIIPESVTDCGWWDRPYEDREERLIRARRLLDFLISKHGKTEDRIAMVSHAGFHNYFIRALLKIADPNNCWFNLANTGISRFDLRENEVGLIYINRTVHLSTNLLTD